MESAREALSPCFNVWKLTNDLKRETSNGSIDLSDWEIVTVGNDSSKDIALVA